MAVPVSELKKSNIIPIIRQCLGLEKFFSCCCHPSIMTQSRCVFCASCQQKTTVSSYSRDAHAGTSSTSLPPLLPTNIICLVIYGNLLGSGSQSGSIWGCKCISIKNFTEKAKVNCPTTTTKAVKRERERGRGRAFSRSFIMLKVCIGACANNFTVE